MPSCLGFFGTQQPLRFAARARSGRALVRAAASTSPNSFYAGSVVRGGDYVDVARLSVPGLYQVVMSVDGIVDVKAGGDPSRQEVFAELYSRRLQMWTGDSAQFINNHVPVGTLASLNLVVGVAMLDLILVSLFTDGDNDPLTIVAITGPLPAGTQVINGVLQGVPTAVGSGSFQVTARDPSGDLGTSQVNWSVTAVAVAVDAGSLTERIKVKTNVGGALIN